MQEVDDLIDNELDEYGTEDAAPPALRSTGAAVVDNAAAISGSSKQKKDDSSHKKRFGQNEKSKGNKAKKADVNHSVCFVAGTLVETETDLVPINSN